MIKKWIVLFLATLFMLAACHSPLYNQTQGNVADVKIRAQKARFKSDNDAKPLPPLVMKSGPYVDTTPISLARQPAWLANHIVIRGDQLPFSYYSRTISAGAGNNVLTKYQVGLDPATNISLNYSGTVKGALDVLAAKTGNVYSIRNNSIYWQAFITRTFDIAFLPGSTDYLMGKKNGGGGSTMNQTSGSQVQNYVTSDSSDSEYSSLSGKISIWDDLNVSIKQMLSPDGKVTVSQATTAVTVRDRPTNVQLVSQYIANLNHNLSKQVLVKIQVLEVTLENDYNFGIDWQIVAKGFHNSPFVINGNYGTPVSITPFVSQPGTQTAPQFGMNQNAPEQQAFFNNHPGANLIPSYIILLNALSQQGHTSIVSEPRVVCLNNQVSVVRIVTQQGYVASIQNTMGVGTAANSTNNTVTSQVTPGNLITGLTLYVLPKILQDSIFLQVNADLSTPIGTGLITQSAGTTTIQVPQITEKHFNQRAKIHSGDTLILSGMRQVKNVANANQFLKFQSLGGKGAQQVNTETIILITPIILPGSA